MKSYLTLLTVVFIFQSCGDKKAAYDASGNFEADELMVSARQSGELLWFPVNEGDQLRQGDTVAKIDVLLVELQKQQAEATIRAVQQRTSSSDEQTTLVRKQLEVQEVELEHQRRERVRTENLVKRDAATRKQLDDIDAIIEKMEKQVAVSRQQIRLYSSNTNTQNRGILSERAPLEKSRQQFQEQVNRGQVINPIDGVVLSRYALRGETVMAGKPLYKIANLDTLTLKAYITGIQLPEIKLKNTVEVRIDQGAKKFKTYPGAITWISNKSEFTPKSIQTKDERANLVYAIKVRVKNDGYLKIGMYGELSWPKTETVKN